MCGICGVVAVSDALNPDIRASINSMTDRLRHRGPDGGGVFTDAHAALGHRRLAIIDRAGGHQPMANEDGSVWIVFNGEVYNHRELRPQLEPRGHRFRTASDTETILHAYEEWGRRRPAPGGHVCVRDLRSRRRELLLARDRLGKKPLFYAMLGGPCTSPARSRRSPEPGWNGEIDLGARRLSVARLLPRPAHGLPARPEARARPLAAVSRGGIDVRQYWDVERFDDDRRSIDALVPELDAMLAERVRDRLESEVPLGAFLSGGIDSGLVVSHMAEALSRP